MYFSRKLRIFFQKIHESSVQSEEQKEEPREVADKTVPENDQSAATKEKVD